MNKLVLVKPTYFKATGNVMTHDKNGKPNVFLQPIAGQIPNKAMVLAGSVAEANGILNSDGSLPNGLQLVIVNETAVDATFGRQFSVSGLVQGIVDGREIVGYQKDLGEPSVLDVNTTTTQDDTDGKNTPNVNTSLLNKGPETKKP